LAAFSTCIPATCRAIESLSQYTPATISRIYSGEGEIIDEFAQERRLFVASEDIPDLVKQAFISAEDKNFYTHHGYDTRSMVAAFVEAVQTRGERVRGASTITQQVMKNFLLSSDRTANARSRKSSLPRGSRPRCPRKRSLSFT
jgi:penicillin-binding protein 1A